MCVKAYRGFESHTLRHRDRTRGRGYGPVNIVQDAAYAALVLTPCAFILLALSIDVIRSRAGGVQIVAAVAAVGAAFAGFIAVEASDSRLQRIERALEQRGPGPDTPTGASISPAQLHALGAGLIRTSLPEGFLFAVLSTCGPAQAQAQALIATLRHAGLTVYAPAQCGPVGTTAALTVVVNARSKHKEPARTAAAIFASVFALPGSAPVIAVPALSGDVIVLLTG